MDGGGDNLKSSEGPWVGHGSHWATAEDKPTEVRDLPGRHSTVSCPAGYAAPYLTVFSENSIDVFDVRKTEWVQTVPLKKVRVVPQAPGPGLGAVG